MAQLKCQLSSCLEILILQTSPSRVPVTSEIWCFHSARAHGQTCSSQALTPQAIEAPGKQTRTCSLSAAQRAAREVLAKHGA